MASSRMELDISIDSAKEEEDYKKWKTFFDCLNGIIRPKKWDAFAKSGNSSDRLLMMQVTGFWPAIGSFN